MKVTMIRHTAVDVPAGVCYGRTDVPLKDTFPQEAEKVKENLIAEMETSSHNFDGVFRSPLSRCGRLAEACGYGDAVADNRLLEMNFGEWEMQPYDKICDPRLQEWYDNWQEIAPTGGESFSDQLRRIKNFLDEKVEEGYQDILIFTHAGVIMNTLLLIGRVQTSNLFDHQPPYGGIVTLTYPPSTL